MAARFRRVRFQGVVRSPLPLRVVGPSNVLSIPDGNPMAGAFYPRMGRLPNDEQGGRHEIQEGVPGIELMVRWTFCATTDVTCNGAPPVAPPPTVPLSPVAPAPQTTTFNSRPPDRSQSPRKRMKDEG